MKVTHWLAALVAAGWMMGGCASRPEVPEGEFLIEGFLENVPDSSVVGLFTVTGHSGRSIAYDTVTGGRFSFRDTITSRKPRKLCINASAFFNPGKGFPNAALTVWVASGEYVRIEGGDRLIRTWTVQSRIPEQEAEEAFRRIAFPEDREVLLCSVEQEALRRESGTAENKRKYQALQDRRDSLLRIINLRKLDYMKDAPVSATWLESYCSLATHYLRYEPDSLLTPKVRSLSGRMQEADPTNEFYDEIIGYLNLSEQTVGEGDAMADGDLYDLDGRLRHLSEFKGKYILLDFWTKGCGPCIRSFPETVEICRQYQGKLEVVGICLSTPEEMKEMVEEYKLAGNQWRQQAAGMSGLAAAYQVNAVPRYVLISPEGRIMKMWSGYGEGSLKKMMRELVQ